VCADPAASSKERFGVGSWLVSLPRVIKWAVVRSSHHGSSVFHNRLSGKLTIASSFEEDVPGTHVKFKLQAD
jgi:formamidopyrimidine-DNA glycosylase